MIKTLSMDSATGDFGLISKEEIKLKSNSMNLNDQIKLSKTGLIVTEEIETITIGSDNYNINFNPETKSVSLKSGYKREGVLFRGPKLEEVPVYGIPVILEDDKSKFGFVPWFSIDPVIKGIKIGNLNVNDSSILKDNKFDFAKKYVSASITMCDIPFITIDRESNMINLFGGIIRINLSNKDVIMNGFTFNPSFFSSILQMQRDINLLKSKIN